MPCPFQNKADFFRILQHNGVFRHRFHGFNNIILLISRRPQRQPLRVPHGIPGCCGVFYLPGNHKHRDGIQPSAQYPRKCICSARSCGDTHRCHPVFQAGVSLRRHRTGLLMMIVGHPQARMMPQCIIQVHCSPADHGENIRDAL